MPKLVSKDFHAALKNIFLILHGNQMVLLLTCIIFMVLFLHIIEPYNGECKECV